MSRPSVTPKTSMKLINGKLIDETGRELNITWVNKSILENGFPKDIGIYSASGNCLAPDVLNGDAVAVTSEWKPKNNDIVMIENPKKGYYAQRYRESEGKQWVKSRHGNMSLDGWTIVAVAVLIARYPNEIITMNGQEYVKLPVRGLSPLPAI